MTELESAAAIALSRLKLYPDSYEQRFVKKMAKRAKREWWCDLKYWERKNLWDLVIKHRKKIGDAALIQEAETNILKHHQTSLF